MSDGIQKSLHDQVEREGELVYLANPFAHRHDECPFDLRTGRRAACVHHPRHRVAALSCQFQLAVLVSIEQRTERDEIVHPAGALVDEHPHRFDIAQSDPGGEGVGEMEIGLLLFTRQRRSDATLSPAGRRQVEFRFGDDPDAESFDLGGPNRGRQPGHAASHHQQIEFLARLCAHLPSIPTLSISRARPKRTAPKSLLERSQRSCGSSVAPSATST